MKRDTLARSIRFLDFETQLFSKSQPDGTANHPPRAGKVVRMFPGDGKFIHDAVVAILEPFAGWIPNTGEHDQLSNELSIVRDAFRRLGLDPDPDNTWDEIASEMTDRAARSKAGT